MSSLVAELRAKYLKTSIQVGVFEVYI